MAKMSNAGTLDWVEPCTTQAAQKLNLEITAWKQGEQLAVFFGVSPPPRDHANWKERRRIREAFRFAD